ncbi:hypothetical protein A9Q81_15645 [Gammaproteobacteria bacterium 42_54_T18]|nr:hypothetical protein A9Q81_15645 [Gammaproteobacteria bacterium 42_54_T18]
MVRCVFFYFEVLGNNHLGGSSRAYFVRHVLSESVKDRIHAPNALAVLAGQAPYSTAASVPQTFLTEHDEQNTYRKIYSPTK